jgi:hypothetical protein
MISQNRADAARQVVANQPWKTVQEEDEQNRQLLDLCAGASMRAVQIVLISPPSIT